MVGSVGGVLQASSIVLMFTIIEKNIHFKFNICKYYLLCCVGCSYVNAMFFFGFDSDEVVDYFKIPKKCINGSLKLIQLRISYSFHFLAALLIDNAVEEDGCSIS